ncbi:uncharacterized protein BDZ99DRAFT_472591 [Mytilinidion resinicola]|uniref:NTF2-domain-containing protein n=1 Tax=Mytilinidion resinicola TaxID=574789 RepID=A0A6A6Z2A0_9PEZI|nr:uncharacterized protein BDZ99DRAFT_472591 [Mytilinidion resinicola]KAF2815292.1 hypothetical protein BDZ99DRAFT_472591 [Mytilinidion resinicola]
MATAEPTMPVNGNYAHHQAHAYGSIDNNYGAAGANSTLPANVSYNATPANTTSPANNNAAEIPKDEVGWYFVEQYYTTLSRSPDKLFLFYNKRSQFVSGIEEEKVSVNVGQKAINDRIKELDFHDCKVRVTNVDSQGSDQNIVIQVIGEISNRGQPHKKFCQTFVLAEQTNGYFVLNDIFRYIAEEPEEEEEQLQQEPAEEEAGIQEPAPTAAENGDDQIHHTPDEPEAIAEVDHKLEDVIHEDEATREASPPPAEVNGTPVPEEAEVAHAEDAPAAAVSAVETPAEEVEAAVEEEVTEPEKPKDPAPTAAAPAAAPAKPVAAPTPAAAPKPKTWAALLGSGNRVATPNVPSPAANATPSQPKAAPSASAPTPPPTTSAAQAAPPAREQSPTNSQGEAGWQTAGAGHKKEQSRSQNQIPTADADNKRAYIKNVSAGVDDAALKAALSKYGEVEYCDISRQKNCAFVDFKTVAGFQAAVAANPHKVNGEDINVEERRLRPGNFPFQRGGLRGRGGPGGPGRGNFPPRGGRGNMGRGRGAPPPA